MHRPGLCAVLLLCLSACVGPVGSDIPVEERSDPVRMVDEHPGFGACAEAVRAALPGPENSDERAAELAECLIDQGPMLAHRP